MSISLKNIKMKPKLIGLFLIVGLAPLILVGGLSINSASQALMKKSFEQLEAIREIKKSQIEGFFKERLGDIEVYAYNTDVQQSIEEFTQAFQEGGLIGTTYQQLYRTHSDKFEHYVKNYGYYDLFLISLSGEVVYNVSKEKDLGQNVKSGPLSKSGLGQAFEDGQQNFSIIDFSWYEISNEPAAFISGPVKNEEGKLIGVLVYQISLEAINQIMQERSGMGKTGETYLVGPDKLMRSDSFIDPTGHSVKASFTGTIEKNGVDTEAVNAALVGKTGAEIIIDYNGHPVLSAYTPTKIGDSTWILLAEIDEAEIRQPINTLVKVILFSGVFIMLAVVLLSLFLALGITKPIIKGVGFAKEMAKGDLLATLDVNQKDEIGQLGQALQEMAVKLKEIVSSVKSATDNVSAGSQELSAAATQLSGSVQEQSAATQELSSSMEEMRANIGQNTDNAGETENIAGKAASDAEKSGQSVNRAVTAMKKIGENIGAIDGIADKIELLALNASIEAARAGEHGKGFAVVANAIKELAVKSKTSATEIIELVKGTVEVAEEAGNMLQAMLPNIQKTAQLVREISAASKEMSAGAGQINQAISQVETANTQNSSSAQELASTSTELASQAGQLQNTISFFKVGDTGATTTSDHFVSTKTSSEVPAAIAKDDGLGDSQFKRLNA